jgi:hypothetical protein
LAAPRQSVQPRLSVPAQLSAARVSVQRALPLSVQLPAAQAQHMPP